MHHTLVQPASAIALASLLTSALAGVAPRQAGPTGGFTCIDDALYKGFFSNTDISYDVQTFCSSELALTDSTVCDHSLTTRTTVYPSASYQAVTTTATTTSYVSTVTVTQTGGVILDMSNKLKARNAHPAPAALITAAPQVVRKALDARAFEKRQNASALDPNGAAAEVYSVCECGSYAGIVTANTEYNPTCYPFTSTITDNQIVYQATTITAFTTVEAAVTTVTVTQNTTANIISAALNTSIAVWTGSWTRARNASWTEWSVPPTASPTSTADTVTSTPISNINSTITGNSTTGSSSPISSATTELSPIMPTMTSAGNSTSTTSTSAISSSTVLPSGCPYINGTTYTPPGSCNQYTRVCGASFQEQDFYGIEPYFSSPELCASLCDADSNGMSPCLGIVWNTSAVAGFHESNCRQLQSLSDPIPDLTAIALILTGQDPSCNKAINMSSSALVEPVGPTGTSNMSYNIPSGTGRPSWTHGGNYKWSGTGVWNYTRSHPTGTGYSHTWNYTRTSSANFTANPYMPSTTSFSNITTSTNYTSFGTGTGTISPIATSNSSTCTATTVTSVSTQLATLYSTLDPATVTVFATNFTTVTMTATTTETQIDSSVSTEIDTTTVFVTTSAAAQGGRYAVWPGNWARDA